MSRVAMRMFCGLLRRGAIAALVVVVFGGGCRAIAGYGVPTHGTTRDSAGAEGGTADAATDIAPRPDGPRLDHDVPGDVTGPHDTTVVPDGPPPWRVVFDLRSTGSVACPPEWGYHTTAKGCVGVLWKDPGPYCSVGFSQAVQIPVSGDYKDVRIWIEGRQWNSTDAFSVRGVSGTKSSLSIDDIYVDGVSIVRIRAGGARDHLFTFAVGISSNSHTQQASKACPGLTSQAVNPPAFVGSAWACDTGNNQVDYDAIWYSPLLWASGSAICDGQKGCYEVNQVQKMTGDIEVRLMQDQCDELVALTQLRIAVR
ncbi:MAG: hypothetical protein KAI47_19425 [Deltaproteobacteria bacterium]|nr:hypothetical protein [Deltaproteobacteria bacterium]